MLKRKPIKSKARKKNPDSDPSRTIDFNEEQLEEFYNSDIKVQIQYKYGSFYGYLLHRAGNYTINIEDPTIFFVFAPDDIKKIIVKKKTDPIIILK